MIKKLAIHSYVMFMATAPAYAGGADTASSHHGGEHHHESTGGLPQLDPSSFASQTFWLIAVFFVLYILMSKRSLPVISEVIEGRTERIKNDLDSSERLKQEVETVQHAYEASIEKAREESSKLFREIEEDIKKRTDDHSEDFREKSSRKISDLEKSIDASRKKAMQEMSEVAAEVAVEAAEKIIGVKADADSVKAVVDSLNKAA